MAARKPEAPPAVRTPIAEWTAAALGLVITLGVVGYTVWEGVTADPGPPRLTVAASGPASPAPGGFVQPIIVRNASHATAAQVDIAATLVGSGGTVEERAAHFAYVPGRGEARGGVVFENDPRTATTRFRVEGYADP